MSKVAVLIPKNGHRNSNGSTFKACCAYPSVGLCSTCASASAATMVEQLKKLTPAYLAQKCAENGWKFKQVA